MQLAHNLTQQLNLNLIYQNPLARLRSISALGLRAITSIRTVRRELKAKA
jgi:hypothetical protein